MSGVPVTERTEIAIAEQCDRGKVREENQDAVRHVQIPLGTLLIVADGIGGYLGGATASRMVVEGFLEHLSGMPPDYSPDEAIREASGRVNAKIAEEANAKDSKYQRMGSTVVLALLQQDASGVRAFIGHIGDSRAYLVRGGELSRLTSDHSAVQALIDRNLITPDEAKDHPDASVLTRSLGHKGEVEIDIEMTPLMNGDSLLLCSDGLWGYVRQEDIQMVVANPELTIERAAKTLLDLALSAGGQDNIGIEIARLSAPRIVAPVTIRRRKPRGLLEILAVLLIILAGMGAIVFLGIRQDWLYKIGHLNLKSAPASEGPQLKPLGPVTVTVISDSTVDADDIAKAINWKIVPVPVDKRATCMQLARAAKEVTVYAKESVAAGVNKFQSAIPLLLQGASVGDFKNLDDQVVRECGDVDVVVIVPSGATGTGESLEDGPVPREPHRSLSRKLAPSPPVAAQSPH